MTIYIVAGGVNYEGYTNLKAFETHEEAVEFMKICEDYKGNRADRDHPAGQYGYDFDKFEVESIEVVNK